MSWEGGQGEGRGREGLEFNDTIAGMLESIDERGRNWSIEVSGEGDESGGGGGSQEGA